jgi:hypothetical protein
MIAAETKDARIAKLPAMGRMPATSSDSIKGKGGESPNAEGNSRLADRR